MSNRGGFRSLWLLIMLAGFNVCSRGQSLPPPRPKPPVAATSSRSKSTSGSDASGWPTALQGGWKLEKTITAKTETPACSDSQRDKYRLFVPYENRDPISFEHEHSQQLVDNQGGCPNTYTANGKKLLGYTITSKGGIKARGAQGYLLIVDAGQCKGDCNAGIADTVGTTYTIATLGTNQLQLTDGNPKLVLLREVSEATSAPEDDSRLRAFLGRWGEVKKEESEWNDSKCAGRIDTRRELLISELEHHQATGSYSRTSQAVVTRDLTPDRSCRWESSGRADSTFTKTARVAIDCDQPECQYHLYWHGCEGDCTGVPTDPETVCSVLSPAVTGNVITTTCIIDKEKYTDFFTRTP